MCKKYKLNKSRRGTITVIQPTEGCRWSNNSENGDQQMEFICILGI